MGFVRKITGQDAAEKAADAQANTANNSIAVQERALERIRGDLAPFRDAGQQGLNQLIPLLTDPNAQKDFVSNNPFFNSLADSASQRVFSNRAARGKLGSGGTASELQNRLLQLGTGLVSDQTNKLFNLSALGQNAAAQTGTATQNVTNSITDINSQKGNALSAKAAAGGNELSSLLSFTGGLNSLGPGGNAIGAALGSSGVGGALSTGLTGLLSLCDSRLKHDIEYLHEDDGVPIYEFSYYGDDYRYTGPIAQELATIKPELVLSDGVALYVNYEVKRAA